MDTNISIEPQGSQYDYIVCGSGSSGSVVARRLAENPDVSVLLLEAGGDDNIPEIMRRMPRLIEQPRSVPFSLPDRR